MRPRIADILTIASRMTDVPVSEIVSHRRYLHLCAVRYPIYVTAREWGYSYPVIGRMLDRDHSTVIHSVQTKDRFDSYIDGFDDFCAEVARWADELPPFVAETDWTPPQVFYVYMGSHARQERERESRRLAAVRAMRLSSVTRSAAPIEAATPRGPRDFDMEATGRINAEIASGSAILLAALQRAA